VAELNDFLLGIPRWTVSTGGAPLAILLKNFRREILCGASRAPSRVRALRTFLTLSTNRCAALFEATDAVATAITEPRYLLRANVPTIR